MGITSSKFLEKLGYAGSRVSHGLSSAQIYKRQHKSEKKFAIEYNSAVMLIINEARESEELKNVAVSYIIDENEHQRHYARDGMVEDGDVFESICIQVMIALHAKITVETAREKLMTIGLYGSMLDGRQRSCTSGEYRYIMKLQPNGMALLVVAHI
ncbi:MAG: hypothetical protein LLF78_03555 [Synergistaceae bacterium]|nr:hypothetical protein [Synergistaceae bacterium]